MLISDILHEFEADWAAMPYVEDEKLKKLKNRTIVISGHKIARCLCYALLYLNDIKNLDSKVILAGETEDNLNDYNSELFSRNDFEFVNFNSLPELSSVDYIVHTAFCCETSDNGVENFKREIFAVKKLGELAAKNKAGTVVLSDSRIYGKSLAHRIYSENEYGDVDIDSAESLDFQLLRAIENFWNCNRKSGEFDLTILRTGIVLCAGTSLNNELDLVFESVANHKKCVIKSSDKKYSFVYISDVFRAIVYALTASLEVNTVYNVAGINSTVSTNMIYMLLNDIYGDTVEITLDGKTEINACAINTNKIDFYGCKPRTELETSLVLCVLCKKRGNKSVFLPHSHDGRRESIQNILLGCLLEIDRICKKHNIKYFLGGGTLLGAIRHHGFIPWDDDGDIMMLREDYDKFCKVAPDELPDYMTFQSSETDKDCFYEFSKLRLNETVFATGFSKTHKDMHNGIAFDIFCHDKTANSRLGQKIHLALSVFTRALVFNKWNRRKADNGNKIQSLFTNICKSLFPIRFSLWLEKRTFTFFRNKKNAEYLYDGMGKNIYNGAFPASYLDEVVYVDFEGCKMPVPKMYDEYLTFLYGDYMQLPPVSARLSCHEIELCDIGQYDGLRLDRLDNPDKY